MPGIMSNVFQPDDGADSGQQASNQTTTLDGGGETGVEASPSVGIGLSGSYEDAEGNSHEWSNETNIGTNVDLDAAIGVTGTLTQDETSHFG